MTTLTDKDIRRAIKTLKESDIKCFEMSYWVDNTGFYKSDLCQIMFGIKYTDEQIQKVGKNGILDTRYGIVLYVSKYLGSERLV